MRLWSLHPKYLDVKGLVAAWREGLLAKKVLEGKTKGYRNHPQLERFKNHDFPLEMISLYLSSVHEEALKRGYNFDEKKIGFIPTEKRKFIKVTKGQVLYELALLKYKLETRDKVKLCEIAKFNKLYLNKAFTLIPGAIEPWEKILPEIVKRIREK